MVNPFRREPAPRAVRGKLALLIPTFRFDARARHGLAAAAALASDDVAVLIADNSEKPEKWAFLDKLAALSDNVHVHCHPENVGALRNWQFLFDRANLPYYQVIGDDDVCMPEAIEAGVSMLDTEPLTATASAPFVMINSRNEMIRANGARLEDTAAARCIAFRIGGGNSLPNSMARRGAVQPFLDYLAAHPLRASFFDWLMGFTLLAAGRYRTTAKGYYFYDVANWESPEACWNSNAGYYRQAGLPEQFTVFHELYWAVETVHFFMGAFSPIANEAERRAATAHVYADRIAEFRAMYRDHRATLEKMVESSPGAVEAMQRLVANTDPQRPELFEWFGRILAAFDRDAALAYVDFVQSSLARAAAGTARAPA